MDELIVRSLRGEATEFERRQISRWRGASPENEFEYERIERIWARLGELEEPGVLPVPSIDALVLTAEKRRSTVGWRAFRRARWTSPWVGMGFAGAAVLALAIFLPRSGHAPSSAPPALASTGSHTGPGDVTTMSLTDGSVVRLAPNTHIEFPPSAGYREVALEGKAFFAVAGADKPFLVRTRGGVVTVLGTRFEVSVDEMDTRVIVVEGSVTLEGEEGTATVSGGSVAYLSPGSPPRVVDPDDVFLLLDWPEGLLVFQDTPLADVTVELSRHFHRDIRVLDTVVGQREITAWFGDESLEEVVSSLCLITAAHCEVSDSIITFER